MKRLSNIIFLTVFALSSCLLLILFLSKFAYSQEIPEGVLRKAYFNGGALKVNKWNAVDENFYGVHIVLYETGELEYEANFENGKLNGITKEYYVSGRLKGEVNYKDGKKDGSLVQ